MQLLRIIEKAKLKNIKRSYKKYIKRDPLANVYVFKNDLRVISKRLDKISTSGQPKQVWIDSAKKLVYVSCMNGYCLQKYSFANDKLKLIDQIDFKLQCVELTGDEKTLFVTCTNFLRGSSQKSELVIIDSNKFSVLSVIGTEGGWSKVIKIDTKNNICYISNWHSNDISIIDISKLEAPIFLQKIKCKEAPRGLCVTSGQEVFGCTFYGKTVFKISININGLYYISDESEIFDSNRYGGNFRDIIPSNDDSKLYISNLGRNLIMKYDTKNLNLESVISVCREPNSIRLSKNGQLMFVSCRKDNVVCLLDLDKETLVGRSEDLGELPTGLDVTDDVFIVSNFNENSIELHRLI